MNEKYSLIIDEVSEKFNEITRDTLNLLNTEGEAVREYAGNIEEILDGVSRNSLIKVAFVGQYSAGKSTVISALTNNREIKIDADIATDEAANYEWNGIVLTDTPGLYTEREDHDYKTAEAIKESDLILYFLTSDLFDDIILKSFVKLAYEDAYRNKMRIVVNKMSMEEGDFNTLKQNYLETLKSSLAPNDAEEFKPVFIDAADYLEGLEFGYDDLLETSHFDDFITSINEFIEEKGLLGKIDKPMRLVISEIGKAVTEINDEGSKEFYMLLERIENRIHKSTEKSQNNLNIITGRVRSEIINIGNKLSASIGEEGVDFEGEQQNAEVDVRQLIEQANEEVEEMLEKEREDLTEEIKEVIESDLAQSFFNAASVETGNFKGENVHIKDFTRLKSQMSTINDLVGKATGGILKLSNADKAPGFIKAGAARGTELHDKIYKIGKFFGHSFKPYEAVNMSKHLTNVAKAAGPVLAIAGVLLEVAGHVKSEADLRKVINAKNQCSSSFVTLSKSTQEEFQKRYAEYKKAAYIPILEDITAQRKASITQQEKTTKLQQELNKNIEKLEGLIRCL